MHRAEGKDGHLHRYERVGDGARAILLYELGGHAPFDEDVEFGAARVRVWGVEATRSEEADRHCSIGADERRKRYAVGANSGATEAGSGAGVRGWVEEIEDEVAVLGDHLDAVDSFRGEEE